MLIQGYQMKKTLLIIGLIFFVSCKNKEKGIVVNSQNELKYSKIKKLELDKHYHNLLSPNNRAKKEYTEVAKTWGDFHRQIGKIVKENNFTWNVKDSSITVLNRIYFTKNGEVDYYTFRVLNKNVSNAKKAEYEKLLAGNISKVKINLKRDKQYAQCGKVRYQNY